MNAWGRLDALMTYRVVQSPGSRGDRLTSNGSLWPSWYFSRGTAWAWVRTLLTHWFGVTQTVTRTQNISLPGPAYTGAAPCEAYNILSEKVNFSHDPSRWDLIVPFIDEVMP